jgi:DNA-binding response OmpR family regulator
MTTAARIGVGVLAKPFDPRQLAQELRALLART